MQTVCIYVSTQGDDSWDGKYIENIDKTKHGPFRTIQRAKDEVQHIATGDIHIVIRGGLYHLTDSVVFGIADGGDTNKKITYENYKGEEPIFTSAIKVEKWTKTDDIDNLPQQSKGRVWKAQFPIGVEKVLTLFGDNKVLQRCHSDFVMPTKEIKYNRMDSLNVATEAERPLLRQVDFPRGLIKKRENMQDIELRFMPVPWTMNLLPISEVDEENCVATLAVEATNPLTAKPKGMRVENDIAYLTEDGSWCADSRKREIYYIPEGDVPKENIYIPTLKQYFLVEGSINYNGPKDEMVENLHFKGLTFRHGMRDTTDDGYKGYGIQHDWEMFDKGNALFRFRGARNCSITECYFHDTSATALRLDLSCQNIKIHNNMFDNIGNMGILLCGYGPGTKDENHHNEVTNNIITRCGEEIWHGHAIFVWQSGYNLIAHNKIHHSARKAIGLCGVRITILERPDHKFDEASGTIRWEEIFATLKDTDDEFERYLPYLHARNNKVLNNDCHNVLEKMGDGSAINISGAGDNNLIQYNYVHHISTYNASAAIRFDDWQCGTTVDSNIIYMCNLIGITRKNYNDVTNNFIIDVTCKNGYIRFASYPNEKPNYGALIAKNIMVDTDDEMEVFSDGYLVSEGACLPQHCDINSNLYWCAKNEKDCYSHLDKMQKLDPDLEKNSQVANPFFKDIQGEDFSFLPNSPALKMGIKPIDRTKIGVTEEYPKHLKSREYTVTTTELFERGKNSEKESYAWW